MFMAEVYGKEQVDSVKWLEVIQEGAKRFPDQDFFIANTVDHYIQKGMVDEGLALMDQLLSTNEKPYFLYVKGVLLYEKKDYALVCQILIGRGSILRSSPIIKRGGHSA